MDESTHTTRFNFDHWATLARENPEDFEAARSHTIDLAIGRARAGKQHRLCQLQWKLDQIRQISTTPLLACLRMNRLMWDSVCGDDGLLVRLNQLQSAEKPARPGCHSAVILPFRRLGFDRATGFRSPDRNPIA